MQRKPVNSTMLASIGYDPDDQVLEVEFLDSGDIYQYFDVSQESYEELMHADSHGEYMQKYILEKHTHNRINKAKSR